MAFNFSVKVFPFNSAGKTRAFASVVVEDTMEVQGFKVIEGSNGLFVSAPNHKSSKKDENGKDIYYDDVRFLDAKENDSDWHTPAQKEIYQAILDKYNQEAGRSARGAAAGAQSRAGSQGGNRQRPNTPGGAGDDQLW